eukprot:1107728-Prymnesium_polylepis.1
MLGRPCAQNKHAAELVHAPRGKPTSRRLCFFHLSCLGARSCVRPHSPPLPSFSARAPTLGRALSTPRVARQSIRCLIALRSRTQPC